MRLSSQQPASAAPLSVNQIYRRAYRGVVEITVTEAGSASPVPGGGAQQAQGSGWVYDAEAVSACCTVTCLTTVLEPLSWSVA